MRVSSSAAVRSNAGSEARLVVALTRRVGHAPVDELGVVRELGADLANAVAQRDHAVEALRGEFVQVLGAVGADVDPPLAHDADGVGMERFRVAAGARGFDRAVGLVFEERLGHLGPSAVAGAQEQDPRPATRSRRAWCRGGRRHE